MMAGVQLYEYLSVWPGVKFCALQTSVATAEPALLKTCNSTFALLNPPGPVSVMATDMEPVPLAASVDGATAEVVNTADAFTARLAADAFQFHSCQVALNTPTSM